MSKLVVLSFGNGDCERGVQSVTLQIWEHNNTLPTKFVGNLPPAPDIPQLYTHWQSNYRQMGARFRLEAKPGQVTNFSSRDIEDLGQALEQRLNGWLRSEAFIPLRDRLFGLGSSEEIQVMIETENPQLRLLPWHSWDFLEQYPKAEVALSALEYGSPFRDAIISRTKGRLLAILGDSTGIDVEADRRELENLPDIETVFLVEPTRKQVYDKLWDYRGWDILFFAGHSVTEASGTEGKIFINRTESLTIPKLKKTLRKAISRGLKLAIFNSCDGLGIASELASLHIPQVIVMREPVPDLVAQEFLKYFLEAFSRPEPLYLAVREARERLEAVQHEFPCATWLPVICQNPAQESLSWQEVLGMDATGSTRVEAQDCQQEKTNDSATSQPILQRLAGTGLNLAQNAAKVWLGVKMVDAMSDMVGRTMNSRTDADAEEGGSPADKEPD